MVCLHLAIGAVLLSAWVSIASEARGMVKESKLATIPNHDRTSFVDSLTTCSARCDTIDVQWSREFPICLTGPQIGSRYSSHNLLTEKAHFIGRVVLNVVRAVRTSVKLQWVPAETV